MDYSYGHACNAITCIFIQQGFRQKIVGGKTASIGEFPWLVLIGQLVNIRGKLDFPCTQEYGGCTLDKPSYQCGGSLIAEYWVLTAAHCFYDRDTKIAFDGYKHLKPQVVFLCTQLLTLSHYT